MIHENVRAWARTYGVALHETPSGVITARFPGGDSFVGTKSPIVSGKGTELEPGSASLPTEQHRYVDTDPVGRAATNSWRSLFSLSAETHRVLSDARFSALGRADALKEARAVNIANVSHDWQRLTEHAVSLAEREHEIFKVPELGPGDAVGAIADWEVRQRVLGLSPAERATLHAQLSRGEAESERVALALNRSPYSLGNDETVARLAWRETVKQRHADAIAALERDQEQLAWGELTVRRIAERVAKLSELSGSQLYDAAAALSMARPHGPAAFFANPAELRAHATRWRTEQAKAA